MELTNDQALQQAVEAHKGGKLQHAEALYRAILQTQPNHPDANHNLGVIAVSLNKSELAVPLFKTALEANPNQGQFWLSYVDALIKTNQLVIAKGVLEQGKKLGLAGERVDALDAQLTPIPSPSKEEVNVLLEHYRNGRYDLAEDLAKKLTQQYPNHQLSWKVLAAVFKRTGRLQQSLIANQKVVALLPNDAQAHSNMGNTLQKLGREEEAEASYKKAIAIKPDLAVAHSNLGNTLKELGRVVEAEASYRKAIAIQPDLAEAHFNLGNALQELGRLEEAENSYRKAVVIKPEYAEAHSNLGNTLKELGRLEDAKASYIKAIAIQPDLAEAHSNLGLLLMLTGDLDGSRNMHEKALKLDTEKWNIYYNYSTYLYEVGHTDSARDSMRSAQFIAPKNKIKQVEICLKAISTDKSVTTAKVDETCQLGTNLKFGLRSDPLILSRPVEDELIVHLYQMNSRILDNTIDARHGNGKCSIDFELFNDKSQIIKVIAQDLTKICQDAVASEVYIDDSFFNIYGAGAGTKIHNHINGNDNFFGLSKRKYSLVYYLDVGDQSGSESGVLRLLNPDQDIMPLNGMIVIINANKKHHALYNGKTDRIMIGVNFYSI
jgi:tetratricopeptide (TPR) repeat protein